MQPYDWYCAEKRYLPRLAAFFNSGLRAHFACWAAGTRFCVGARANGSRLAVWPAELTRAASILNH